MGSQLGRVDDSLNTHNTKKGRNSLKSINISAQAHKVYLGQGAVVDETLKIL
jgi:hypothetical protein